MTKQPSSPTKQPGKKVQKVSLQPATGESLEIGQIYSEQEPLNKTQVVTKQLKSSNINS